MRDIRTYVYDKNYNLIKTYLAGSEEEIRKMEGEGVYLSEVIFINPIVDEFGIREMSQKVLLKKGILKLEEGQYLNGDEIITVGKPDNFHFWDTDFYDQE